MHETILDTASPMRTDTVAVEPGLDLPLGSGGTGSERHAAWSMVSPSMLARASTGVR
jgi:hypothetical protein